MGFQNEELVEELLWKAYLQNKAEDLIRLAGDYIRHSDSDRIEAYERASVELGLNN